MKFLNKALCLAALFAIGSVVAKPGKRSAAAKPKAYSEANAPVASQQTMPVKTFKQLHSTIPSSAIVNGNKLNNTFIQNMVQQVKAADLGTEALTALLQTARDKFATFSNDNTEAFKQLIAIEKQIDDAVEQF